MRKRNSLDKIDVIVGCVRETPHIKTSQHGMCKRNSPQKNKACMGYVRKTPQIKEKPAWDV